MARTKHRKVGKQVKSSGFGVSSAIPTTTRPERIQENAQAAEAAALPQSFRDYIQKEAERCL